MVLSPFILCHAAPHDSSKSESLIIQLCNIKRILFLKLDYWLCILLVLRSNLSNVQTFTVGNEIFYSRTNSAWSDNFIIYIAGVPYYRRVEAAISSIKVASRPFFVDHTMQMKLFLLWPGILYIMSDIRSVLDLWKQELHLSQVFSSGAVSVGSEWSCSPTYTFTAQNVMCGKCSCIFGWSFCFFLPFSEVLKHRQWFNMFLLSVHAIDWEKVGNCLYM